MARVLVVDASAAFRETMEYGLPKFGHTVCSAATGEEAARIAAMVEIDLALVDLGWPHWSGLDACRQLAAGDPAVRIPVVLVTGCGSGGTVAQAAGAVEVLQKPFAWGELLAVIARRARRR